MHFQYSDDFNIQVEHSVPFIRTDSSGGSEFEKNGNYDENGKKQKVQKMEELTCIQSKIIMRYRMREESS